MILRLFDNGRTMGADQSTSQVTIYPHIAAICATEPRFCLPHNVHLSVSQSDGDFKITDALNKNKTYFHCESREFLLGNKKVLLDMVEVPVLNMEKIVSLTSEKFNIFAGDGSGWQIGLLKLQPTFRTTKMSAVFPDSLSGMQRHLVLKGDWASKQCRIYLGEPKEGGIPLARVHRPPTITSLVSDVEDYNIEIIANVDIAICVIMCIATDEAVKNYFLVEDN